jgi:hypothetical protein
MIAFIHAMVMCISDNVVMKTLHLYRQINDFFKKSIKLIYTAMVTKLFIFVFQHFRFIECQTHNIFSIKHMHTSRYFCIG